MTVLGILCIRDSILGRGERGFPAKYDWIMLNVSRERVWFDRFISNSKQQLEGGDVRRQKADVRT